MAFELSLIVSGTTYSLSDGNPYSVQDAVGLGLPPVQRFSARYPRQDGYDDSGFVLEPRVVTLALSFVATTASALDGYRDDLLSMFSPGVTATLQVTRDDGETRRVDVVTTSAPQITLDPAHRPGNLHRAVVQLRAADPIWYAPSPGTVTFGTTDISTWYLASSTIDDDVVLEATQNPGSAQVWNWGTATQTGQQLSVAIRGTVGTALNTYYVPWRAPVFGAGTPHYGTVIPGFYRTGTGGDWGVRATSSETDDPGDPIDTVLATDSSGWGSVHTLILTMTDTRARIYYNGVRETSQTWNTEPNDFAINPTASYWRAFGFIANNSFGTTAYTGLSHAATYNVQLSDAQVAALSDAMNGTFAGYAASGVVPYTGSYDDLPVITLTGPLGDPVVTNVTTSRKLDFTGSTIPAGVTYTIDLSRDTLSVVDQGGTIHTDELTDDSDLGSWTIAAGQSNYVQVTAATSGTASAAQIVYRNRYVSY